MKKFAEVIKIEVAVQDIANKLLGTFPEDYKHREMLTETIIGTALAGKNISYIYNALNGYSAEIDFKVGDRVICTEGQRRVVKWEVLDVEENTGTSIKPVKKGYDYTEIGECEIIEIDLYRDSKLKVKFLQDDSYKYNEQEETTSWVNHRNCTLIPMEEVMVP
jgi:hypothetical protein